jgi:hypothetical protein
MVEHIIAAHLLELQQQSHRDHRLVNIAASRRVVQPIRGGGKRRAVIAENERARLRSLSRLRLALSDF